MLIAFIVLSIFTLGLSFLFLLENHFDRIQKWFTSRQIVQDDMESREEIEACQEDETEV